MEVTFRKPKLQRIFETFPGLEKAYGKKAARKITERMAVLQNAPNLAAVPTSKPERRHQLVGKRKGQFAVDAGAQLRLVFEPSHEHMPKLEDGGIDVTRVIAILILEVVDYHD